MNGLVGTILHESEFKLLCDGLLRFAVSSLVQTYSASGRDDGIDADFIGTFGNVTGRWVFQFKFISPAEAPTRQRARIKAMYCGKRGTSEFDRAGVAGAAGYVLLTNVPASVHLVRSLRQRWRQRVRGRRAPMVVWDLMQLNALLKGHEHLARSWSGVKEARCREHVVLPIWHWLERARPLLADAEGHPVWPITFVEVHERVRQDSFTTPFKLEQWRVQAIDKSELDYAMSDPQFEFARSVVYRNGFERFDDVVKALDNLASCVGHHIDEMVAVLGQRIPKLAELDVAQRRETTTWLATAVLEVRWGYPSVAWYSFRDDQFVIGGGRYMPCPREAEHELNALIHVGRGVVPDGVRLARAALGREVQMLSAALWNAVEFGLDAPSVDG